MPTGFYALEAFPALVPFYLMGSAKKGMGAVFTHFFAASAARTFVRLIAKHNRLECLRVMAPQAFHIAPGQK